jgi:hypothetical protein
MDHGWLKTCCGRASDALAVLVRLNPKWTVPGLHSIALVHAERHRDGTV